MGERGRSATSAALRELSIVAYFVLLSCLALRTLFPHFATSTLVGPDPLIDLYTVHWLASHLLHPGALFGGNIFAPASHGVLYSDLSMGTVVLVAPLRLFVHDPVPLYNLSLVAALAFGGWSFCTLTRSMTGGVSPGLLAGTLAAFSSHQMSHVYHLNLLTIGWLALFLLGLERLLKRPGIVTGLLLAVSFALTAESSGYYAVAAALLALVFVAVHFRRLGERGLVLTAIGGTLLALLLLAPYLRAFGEVRAEDQLRRPIGMSEKMAFQPARDVSSVGVLDREILGSSGERLFPGFLAIGLLGLALKRRTTGMLFPGVGALVLLVLSLGPYLRVGASKIPLPYLALVHLPFMDGMRHPYTFAAVAVFLVAVLAGQGFATLQPSARLASFVVALGVAETLAPPPVVGAVPEGIPPVYTLVFSRDPGVVLEVPPFEPQTLLWAARHGRPVANGAGAFVPRNTLLLDRYIENHWIHKTPASVDASPPTDLLVEQFNVRYVIVPVGRKPGLLALARAFEGSAVFTDFLTSPDGDRVFRLERSSAHPGEGREQLREVAGEDRQPVRQEQ